MSDNGTNGQSGTAEPSPLLPMRLTRVQAKAVEEVVFGALSAALEEVLLIEGHGMDDEGRARLAYEAAWAAHDWGQRQLAKFFPDPEGES